MKWLLFPLTWPYGLIVWLRNLAYDRGWLPSHAPAVPVISVGNLSTGGTGKTPVAEWLLRHLAEQGVRVAYLSRGYGRRTRGYLRVDPVQGGAQRYGDEALQVARKFPDVPVAVCEDRVRGVERLVAEANVDLVVLDDAFQHRRIQRDLELLVIDGLRLPTQDWLLPLGRLREPRRSLRRADLLLVNKLYDPSALPKVRQALAGYQRPLVLARPVAEALYHWQNQPPQPLAVLKGQAVILLAGIGNPDAFRQQVEALGADVVGTHFYRDHHAYRPADFRRLRAALTQHPKAWVILTEKDQARLLDASWAVDFADLPLYALRISLAYWEGEAALTQALARVVSLTQASA